MKKAMTRMGTLLLCLLLCSMAYPANAPGGSAVSRREATCWQVDLDAFSGQVSAHFPGPGQRAPRFRLSGPAGGQVRFWAVYYDENGAPASPQGAAGMQLVLHCPHPTSGRVRVRWDA